MDRTKVLTLPLMMPLIMGTLLLLNALDNPRLASAHITDLIKLVAVGLCFGAVFGVVMSDYALSRGKRRSL